MAKLIDDRERILFIDGWITQQYERGNRPDLKESSCRLPEVAAGATMEVVTGFMAKKP